MSRASEWAAWHREHHVWSATDPMAWHAKQPRPRWGPTEKENAWVYVDGNGDMSFMGAYELTPDRARALAHWITETFGETA